jgi:F0F1-type ATP synthase delta subunit
MLKQMRKRHRSRHYARAFLRVFGTLPEKTLFKAIDTLSSYYEKNRLVFRLLQFSSARRDAKIEAMEKLCDKLQLPEPISNLVGSLIKRKAIELLPTVLCALRSEFKKSARIYDFTVTSSHALSAEQKEAIERQLTKAVDGTLVVTYREDSSLIAGIRLQSPTYYWEESIARRIQNIRQTLYTQEQL